MSAEEILQRVIDMETPVAEVTGGEPLLQQGARPLLQALCDTGKTVLLETSGERDISGVDGRVRRIMDIKTPSSGESERVRWRNIEHLTATDEVKFVIQDRRDYEWARGVVKREGLGDKAGEVLMSPVHGSMEPRQLVAWILEDKLPVRVQLQIHKFIWHPDERGV
jgi:7-carboxy-7-deazaguanine synthase